MDLSKLFAMVSRHRWLFGIALVVGVILGVLALYQPSLSHGPAGYSMKMKPRALGTYQSDLSVLIEDSKFGLGRTDVGIRTGVDLAPTYAYLVTSQPVLDYIQSRTGRIRETILAEPVVNSPVVKISVEGPDSGRVVQVASAAGEGLRSYIKKYVRENSIPTSESATVRILGAPSRPEQLSSRGIEIAAIVFLAPLIIAFGLSALIESLVVAKVTQEGSADVGVDAPGLAEDVPQG